jgi:hypothetical protein
MINIFLQNALKVSKKQNLMGISNPLKKLQKTHVKKVINEKVSKNGYFDFYYCVQRFSAYNFFG